MTDDDELKRAKGKFEKYPNEPPEVKEQKKSWMDRTVAGDINKVKEYATEKYEKVKEKFIEPASKEDASEKKAAKEIRKEVKDVEKEKSESSEPRRKTLGEQQLQWAKEKYNREHQQKFGLGNIGGGLNNIASGAPHDPFAAFNTALAGGKKDGHGRPTKAHDPMAALNRMVGLESKEEVKKPKYMTTTQKLPYKTADGKTQYHTIKTRIPYEDQQQTQVKRGPLDMFGSWDGTTINPLDKFTPKQQNQPTRHPLDFSFGGGQQQWRDPLDFR